MSAWEFDLEIQHRDGAGALTSLYFNTDGYQPTPAVGRYRKRLRQPLSIVQHLWAEARTRGPRVAEHGGLELENGDGALDALRDYSFDDCPFELTGRGAMSGITFTGRLGQPEFSTETVSFPVRDLTHTLTKPLLTTRYTGANSGGLGLEGTANDLKGRLKPVVLGIVKNWEPPCVNVDQRIYQVSAWQLQSGWSLTVYVRRVAASAGISRAIADFQAAAVTGTVSSIDTATDVITFTASFSVATGTAVNARTSGGTLPAPLVSTQQYYYRQITSTTGTLHPTQADANANTNTVNLTTAGTGTRTINANMTAEGQYDWCNDASAGMYFRLGTAPDGLVTCDPTNPLDTTGILSPPTPSANGVAALCKYLLVQGGISSPFIASLGATNGTTATCGLVVDDDRTVLDCINQVAGSLCAGWFLTDAPSLTLSQLVDPTGGVPAPSAEVSERQVIAIERITPADDDAGVPAWRVVVNYARVYRPMEPAELASSVSAADVEFVGREYRQAIATNSAVKTQWPRASEIVIYTELATEAYAQALADGLLDLYEVRRDLFRITVPLAGAVDWDLGKVVTVTHRRWGLSGGEDMLVISLKPDYAAGTVTFWGWC